MKIILTENIKGLGQIGETVEVKSGYARNFLMPKKMAVLATAENIKKVDEIKIEKKEAAQQSIQEMKEVGERLKDFRLIIETKADEKGNLYAGINSKTISDLLKERGIEAPQEFIEIAAEPIKKTGIYRVMFKFYDIETGFEAEVVGL
ncbi:MAG: 50S ribosomal protein L9 [Patescibacteria group bacterium]